MPADTNVDTSHPRDNASTSTSPFTRENWWGNTETTDRETGHAELPGTSIEEYKAHTILRSGAHLLCPECMHHHKRTSVLSDPSEYVPKEVETSFGTVELHVLRHRRRVCPHEECGYVSFGGVVADRPAAEFMALVDEVLDALDIPPNRERKLRSDAKARKNRGRQHDTDIMEAFVHDLLNPESASD
ncbi:MULTISPECIES: hypothetical protein [Halorussus]|uniref:hypothetical protein n=1 Tax=Halorussus TaxID=1070314 RepID=UPI0020A1A210|nr:hypothetical protein [Halorussus vallis]USZ78619.1 hypothetical protein NGM07_25050 [Halorussus vallis]